MLTTSRLYSFLDREKGFTIHFLEGQKLIQDLVLNHHLNQPSFSYFRDTILSFLPIISFLKNNESLGIYIDSDDPYFIFKIETNFAGYTRTLLLPENLAHFPTTITGQARVTKQFQNSSPYTSIVDFKNTKTSAIANIVLNESYQVKSNVIVSDCSDQSILISKLPAVEINKIPKENEDSLNDYIQFITPQTYEIFKSAFTKLEDIVAAFERLNLFYLSSRQVEFFCSCSREDFLDKLIGLYGNNSNDLFTEKNELEVKCDYCKKVYHYTKADLDPSFQ